MSHVLLTWVGIHDVHQQLAIATTEVYHHLAIAEVLQAEQLVQ